MQLRIVGGSHRGRRFYAPESLPVRPTTDFAKESLFNILENTYDFEEVEVLDLFSGTGNISFEFSSRGTPSITAVEQNFRCVEYMKKTVENFQLENIKIIKGNAFTFLKNAEKKYDLIFADPPYDHKDITNIPLIVLERDLLKPDGLLIVEHGPRTNFPTQVVSEKRTYGNCNFSFFKKPEA